MKQTILHINIHGNRSDVSSHHQEKPGCRCLPVWESTLICDSVLKAQRREGLDARAVDEMLLQVLEMDGGGGWERLLLCWQTENNHKITFLLSPSHTKRQVFFPSSAPSSFFFFFLLPSAAHNSEHWWLPWSTGLDSVSRTRTPPPTPTTPSALYVEYCTGLNRLTELRVEDASTPFLFLFFSQTGSQVTQGFSPSLFTLSILTSFFHFLSFFSLSHTQLPPVV